MDDVECLPRNFSISGCLWLQVTRYRYRSGSVFASSRRACVRTRNQMLKYQSIPAQRSQRAVCHYSVRRGDSWFNSIPGVDLAKRVSHTTPGVARHAASEFSINTLALSIIKPGWQNAYGYRHSKPLGRLPPPSTSGTDKYHIKDMFRGSRRRRPAKKDKNISATQAIE